MAKVDAPDPLGVFLNPAAYSHTREEIKKDRNKPLGASRKSLFSTLLGTEKSLTELGAPPDLPVSGETLNQLMDDVRAAGDDLRNRPFPDEILHYKRAVRDFMYYVVKNGFQIQESEGIPKFLKPGYTGPRGTPESWERKAYVQIQIIDKKLEDMAAVILTSQINQLELTARLEEITGLLVDLFQ